MQIIIKKNNKKLYEYTSYADWPLPRIGELVRFCKNTFKVSEIEHIIEAGTPYDIIISVR